MTRVRIDIQEKRYPNAAPSIQGLHLELTPGEFVCLVGPSGCGKTTLLNILAGLDPDYQGAVEIGTGAAQPRIGYMFQNPRLLPWRTVRDNIALALPAGTDSAYVDHLFEVVGLTEARDLYPEQLSLGMSRRAALVRAFAINPDFLLMDEPFVSLDPPTARRVRELLVTLWQERPHTVLFVTHDLREAVELADRLVFLAKSPASVIATVPVPLARDRRDEAAVDEFRKSLDRDYPVLRSLL
jgi:ABC-type nitrate/sulfonate/bicarbonate transport system ATPase subunit